MTSSTVTMLYNHRYCIILEHFQLALKALCTARIMPLMCGRYWKSRASRGPSLDPRELRDRSLHRRLELAFPGLINQLATETAEKSLHVRYRLLIDKKVLRNRTVIPQILELIALHEAGC